jgi:hypothetical protein
MGRDSKKKSEFVGALGVAFELVKRLSDAVREQGGDDEDLRRVLKQGSPLPKQFAELVLACRPRDTYPVSVQCGELTLGDMIKVGKYDYINPDITLERFPIGKETYNVDLILVHFGRDMTTEQVEAELEKQGLRAGKIEELLALGDKYPDIQREFPVISLGSSALFHGYRNVPCISGRGSGRSLYLYWRVNAWYDDCRFLAVRK